MNRPTHMSDPMLITYPELLRFGAAAVFFGAALATFVLYFAH